MFTHHCTTHQAHALDAAARVRVSWMNGISATWTFGTKPYATRRPSGAPPG